MEWIKVCIATPSADTDLLAELILSWGIAGVEIVDPREYRAFLEQDKSAWDYVDESLVHIPDDGCAQVIFYLCADPDGERTLAEIQAHLTGMGYPAPHTQRVADTAWLEEWKKHFAPIRVGRVAIVPAWERAQALSPPAEITFTLDPGSAFGTGQHASTFLCVEALQERLQPGQSLLDAGCGSGILSVIGLLLGAARVFACDIDPAAITATRKNAELNPVELSRLTAVHGNILTEGAVRDSLAGHTFDIIVANIVADVIIALLPLVPALLAKGGYFIASGIIDERGADVLAALADSGLALVSNKEMDGWLCVVCAHA
ncbi:MAG: 50S ribosomal protein L11 methyltransferase [Defluviitaleaceae bacterium]|nr:50S ribosomal protein L11 methyltransferase [Defluviitaleaceae bacterium]MCL2239840.1 50S ribosomal protein L11 methyltransferase [Defluviitaleaceae bacterium]